MPENPFQINSARSPVDIKAVARLFSAYASSLRIDISFQGFAAELETLPGNYAPPDGELLLARDIQRKPLGCVGLRPMKTDGCCEMKRLYVSSEGRGIGLGRALVEAITRKAARLGYREIRLDTLPDMVEAIALYRKTGFMPIKPYYETPLAGTIFLGRKIDS